MTKQERIHNWLVTALKQPTNLFSEMFYFDKKDNEFFSILISDYFLFDEDLSISEDVSTTYSKHSIEALTDRVNRIENQEDTIVQLPRLGTSSDNQTPSLITQQIDNLLNLHNINVDTASIWEVEEAVTITISLNDDTKTKKKAWWEIWK